MFDHLLESSHRDDSYKWSNIGFGQEVAEIVSIEVNLMHLIWSSAQEMIAIVKILLANDCDKFINLYRSN